MDDRQHKVYFDRQILPVPSGPKNNSWSMMSEVWEGEKIAKESLKGRAHHWKVEPVGLPPSIRRQFQLVEQSPRVLEW